MSEHITVTTVVQGREVPAGVIHRARRGGSFAYDTSYLQRREAFELAPSLPLFPGNQSLFPAQPFSDSAPDTWGRKVLNRAAGRSLDELSLLLGVNDESRQGATRFWVDGVATAPGDGVPAEPDLPSLLQTADAVDRGDADIPDVATRRLFQATGSLGGARPKANVRRGNTLWLAKFPKPQGDNWNVMAWEAAVLDLMGGAGITTPEHQSLQLTIDGAVRTVLLLRRFDRGGQNQRIPYLSAMTMLEAHDGDGGDWLDLAEITRAGGGDTTELWRRAVFGALVGNLDNHLRNHGFLRQRNSWRLAPVFDVNPTPLTDGTEHQLSLLGSPQVTAEGLCSDEALELFGVNREQAALWLSGQPRVLRKAAAAARSHGADERSIGVMSDRFTAAEAQAATLSG